MLNHSLGPASLKPTTAPTDQLVRRARVRKAGLAASQGAGGTAETSEDTHQMKQTRGLAMASLHLYECPGHAVSHLALKISRRQH
jgi:hypothetical protein